MTFAALDAQCYLKHSVRTHMHTHTHTLTQLNASIYLIDKLSSSIFKTVDS